MRFLWPAVLVVAAVAIGGASAAQPGGEIVVSAQRRGPELTIASADGSAARPLSSHLMGDVSGVWSPDGRRVAYLAARNDLHDTPALGVAAVDGSSEHLLPLDANAGPVTRLTWSPDGAWIEYETLTPRSYTSFIRLVRPDGTGARILGVGRGASWAPDSRSLVAGSSDGFGSYDVASGAFRPIAAGEGAIRSPAGDVIAYTAPGDCGEVRVVAPDGSGDRALVDGTAVSWSPDGTRLAVRDCSGGVSVVGLDGTIASHVPGASDVAWSPDGRELLYQAGDILYAVAVDGGSTRVVARGTGGSWSPDGRRILYLRPQSAAEPPALYALRPEDPAGVARQIVAAGTAPAFSPDGRRLAYVADSRLVVAAADGGNPRRIGSGQASDPSWSPDGSRIVYSGGGEIATVRATGGPSTVIHPGLDPAWSPRGDRIAFVDRRGRLWTIHPDGTHLRRVETGKRRVHWPAWSPDGRFVAVESYSTCPSGAEPFTCTTALRARPDGGPPVELPPLGPRYRSLVLRFAQWSPDGRSLLVSFRGEPSSRAVVVILPTDPHVGPVVTQTPVDAGATWRRG